MVEKLPVAREFVGMEKILGQDVRLVVRRLLGTIGSAIVRMVGDVRNRAADDARQKVAAGGDSGQTGCIQHAHHVLIEDVAGPRDRGLLTGVRVAVGPSVAA